MSEIWIPIRKVKCPKCNREPTRIVEMWERTLSFDVLNGHRDAEGYGFDGGTTTGRVLAECDCGHAWRLRRVRQVTDLDRGEQLKQPPAQEEGDER